MTKPIELIYSRQSGDFIAGRAYSNPRYFSTARAGVSKVFLVGDWPDIRAAYEALGVPVEQLDEGDAQGQPAAKRAAPASLTPALAPEERSAIYIPDDWADLPFNKPKAGRDLTLRGLAAMFSAEPVINKAQAAAAITAELARRAAEEEGSNGLTRREMNADLDAAGIEIDPALPIDGLVALHSDVRAAREAQGVEH